MSNAIVEEFSVGIMLITVGLLLDHTVGVIAAVVGFAAITLGLGTTADLVARHVPSNHGQHLSLRRWSRF